MIKDNASGAGMEPLPEPVRMSADQSYLGFTADQMHEYAAKHAQAHNAKLEAQVEQLRAALELARQELSGLPRSLGYDFTHLPKILAALKL